VNPADPALRAAVLARLARLPPGATTCPGRVARDVGRRLAELRPLLAALAAEGRLAVYQRGRPAALAGLRGPFRVAAAADPAKKGLAAGRVAGNLRASDSDF
jgi:hypothetical protein